MMMMMMLMMMMMMRLRHVYSAQCAIVFGQFCDLSVYECS